MLFLHMWWASGTMRQSPSSLTEQGWRRPKQHPRTEYIASIWAQDATWWQTAQLEGWANLYSPAGHRQRTALGLFFVVCSGEEGVGNEEAPFLFSNIAMPGREWCPLWGQSACLRLHSCVVCSLLFLINGFCCQALWKQEDPKLTLGQVLGTAWNRNKLWTDFRFHFLIAVYHWATLLTTLNGRKEFSLIKWGWCSCWWSCWVKQVNVLDYVVYSVKECVPLRILRCKLMIAVVSNYITCL